VVLRCVVNSETCASMNEKTKNSTLFSGCKWCERDNTCYDAEGSLPDPCSIWEDITDPKYCTCNPPSCRPKGGVGACTWYTTSTKQSPPSQWGGADFLFSPYATAAQCACEGDGNTLWLTPVANCVRHYILTSHQGLSDGIKWKMRNVIRMDHGFRSCPSWWASTRWPTRVVVVQAAPQVTSTGFGSLRLET
jgi:hypothetical protein